MENTSKVSWRPACIFRELCRIFFKLVNNCRTETVETKTRILNVIKIVLHFNTDFIIIEILFLWNKIVLITDKFLITLLIKAIKKYFGELFSRKQIALASFFQKQLFSRCSKFLFLIKLKASNRLATLLRKKLRQKCFLWILQNFYEQLFYRIPLGDCFYFFGNSKVKPALHSKDYSEAAVQRCS